jgi:ribosomal silencing factor RsfS
VVGLFFLWGAFVGGGAECVILRSFMSTRQIISFTGQITEKSRQNIEESGQINSSSRQNNTLIRQINVVVTKNNNFPQNKEGFFTLKKESRGIKKKRSY